jgi:hypothetical protein
MRSPFQMLALLACVFAVTACASSKPPPTNINSGRASMLSADTTAGGERCERKPGREVSEYDTSGDNRFDVRKVFLAIGTGVDARLVLICRETDVNGDGKKDVIRYYDDDGRTLREESDRDFDGRMDLVLVFQDGKVVREELDENHDGKVDTKVFLDNGKPMRSERDLKGRSTPDQWHPDRWEYYEQGKMVRMGTDLDGDSRVDRWDRDAAIKKASDQTATAAPGTTQEDAATDGSVTSAPAAAAPPASAKPAAKSSAAKTTK